MGEEHRASPEVESADAGFPVGVMDGIMCLGTACTGVQHPAWPNGVAASPSWLRGRGDVDVVGSREAGGGCIGYGRQSKGVMGERSGRSPS